MKFSTKTLACALLATGGATIWACSSSDSNNGAANSGGACTQNIVIQYSPMYSAVVDGAPNKAQVPVILTQDGKEITDPSVTWTTSDKDSTSLDTDAKHPGGRLVTVTNMPAGGVTITGSFAGCTKASTLTVSQFTSAQYAAGVNRYKHGAAGAPDNGQLTIPDGGVPACTSQADIAKALKPAACTNCHGTNALQNLPFKTIEHTPEQTGGFSDAELKDIILNGKLPQGFTIDTNAFPGGTVIWGLFHKWEASEDEVTGLIAYLRTLTPTPQDGSFDFQGLGGGDAGPGGGGQVPNGAGCDSGTPTTVDSGSTPADAGAEDAASD